MVDLFDYFQCNNKGTWYEKFEQLIESEFNLCADIQAYAIYDEHDAQENIKELCQPGKTSIYGVDDNIKFILNCFYLWKQGYSIEQFPNVIARPKSLGDFAETEIRNYAFKNELAEGNTVRWATRRLIIDEFKWIKEGVLNNITPTDTLAETFKKSILIHRGGKICNSIKELKHLTMQ